MVLHGPRQWSRLMNDQDVILIVLPQVLLGKVKPLHTGDLQLKQRGGSVDGNADDRKGACEGREILPAALPTSLKHPMGTRGHLYVEFAEKMGTCKNLKSTRSKQLDHNTKDTPRRPPAHCHSSMTVCYAIPETVTQAQHSTEKWGLVSGPGGQTELRNEEGHRAWSGLCQGPGNP